MQRRPSLVAFVAVLGATLSAGPSSRGAPPESKIALTVRGVSGPVLRVRPRRFNALSVVVENLGAVERRGVLRAYRCEAPGDPTPSPAVFYEREVSVPSQGRRVETLPYYVQELEPDDRLCVAFAPSDGGPAPLPTYPQVQVLAARAHLVLVVASRPVVADGAARLFQRATVPCPLSPQPVLVERATPETLPTHFAGYEPFDSVLLVDVDPDALPDALAGPLLRWTAGGGDLLVAWPGRGAPLPPALAAVLPVDGDLGASAARIALTPLRHLAPQGPPPAPTPVPVARVTLRPGAVSLAEGPAGPLVVRGRHGAGGVTFLAFPLDASPLLEWPGSTSGELASALLRPTREDPEAGAAAPPAPPMEELLLNVSEGLDPLTPPAAWLIAPALLLYVLLVGPGAYFAAARRRRPGWTHMGTGALAAAFAAGFWVFGAAYKGSETLSTQVGLAEFGAGGGARVEVLSGHYSPARGFAEGGAPEGAVVGPVVRERAAGREAHVAWTGEAARLTRVALDTWGIRQFRSLRVEEGGGVELDLTLDPGNLLRGTIENRTRHALETPTLLLETGVVPLDPLAAGQRLALAGLAPLPYARAPSEVNLLRAVVADANGTYSGRYGLPFGPTALGRGAPFGGERGRVLAALRRRAARAPLRPGHTPLLLAARVRDDPGGVTLGEDATVKVPRVYVLAEGHAALAAGRHHLAGLVPRVAHHTAGRRGPPWSANQGATGTSPVLGGDVVNPEQPGWVEWRWRLPASPGAPLAIEALRVRLTVDPTPASDGLLRLAGYDFARGRWSILADLDALSPQQGAYVWPERPDRRAASLVDPSSGVVALRLQNHGPEVVVPAVTLDVTFTR